MHHYKSLKTFKNTLIFNFKVPSAKVFFGYEL